MDRCNASALPKSTNYFLENKNNSTTPEKWSATEMKSESGGRLFDIART
jgi:hypothetical protein